MNWEAISAIGEIIGAVAVVGSLVYVATQIRVHNKVAQRDSRMYLVDIARQAWSGAAESPALAEVRVKLKQRVPELTPEEVEIAKDWATHFYLTLTAVGIAADSNTIGDATREAYLLGLENTLTDYPGVAPILRALPRINGIRAGLNPWWDEVLAILDREVDAIN